MTHVRWFGVGAALLVTAACGGSDEAKKDGTDAGTDGAGATGGTGGTGATGGAGADAGPDSPACTEPPLTCVGLDPSTSTFDGMQGDLVLGLVGGAADIVSGTLTRVVDCGTETQVVPISVTPTTLTADLVPDGGDFIHQLSACQPATLDLVDSCGRQLQIQVVLTYSSEGVPLAVTCPDGGS